MIIGNLLYALIVDYLFGEIIAGGMADVMGAFIGWVTRPLRFAWGQAISVYFQGIALVIAIVVIVVNGVARGYLRCGGTQDMSSGAYIFRSLWPVALIAACPSLMGALTDVISTVIADATGGLATTETFRDMVTVFVELSSGATVIGPILVAICALVITYYIVTVLFQCVKRQLQLAVYSVIAPLIAATTVADSSSGDFVTLLKEMFGIAVITVMQLSALMAAISAPATIKQMLAEDASCVFIVPLVSVALFAAVKQIPTWIERYTLAPAVGGGGSVGRSVGTAVMFGGRSAITSLLRR